MFRTPDLLTPRRRRALLVRRRPLLVILAVAVTVLLTLAFVPRAEPTRPVLVAERTAAPGDLVRDAAARERTVPASDVPDGALAPGDLDENARLAALVPAGTVLTADVLVPADSPLASLAAESSLVVLPAPNASLLPYLSPGSAIELSGTCPVHEILPPSPSGSSDSSAEATWDGSTGSSMGPSSSAVEISITSAVVIAVPAAEESSLVSGTNTTSGIVVAVPAQVADDTARCSEEGFLSIAIPV